MRRTARKASRRAVHRPARRAARKEAAKTSPKTTTAAAQSKAAARTAAIGAAPPWPKSVATVPISTPALAFAPADGRTKSFAHATEAWSSQTAFVPADEAITSGVTIARSDVINAIDLAADSKPKAAEHADMPERAAAVSFVTPANAAPSEEAAAAPARPPAAEAATDSWMSQLYGKAIDAVLTAVLAVRSWF
jgi:hypothetical protein